MAEQNEKQTVEFPIQTPEIAVNPTKQHAAKCPKLHGKECKCDGYHTFEELYEHRMALFVLLCNELARHHSSANASMKPWKSKLHSDGTMFDGDWFIAGINTAKGEQMTYHLRTSIYWDALKVQEMPNAPEWDGHTAEDVVKRLLKYSEI
jgi:hypothetical protein